MKITHKSKIENIDQDQGELVSLKNALSEKEKEVAELKNHYIRALADYKNLENRQNQERQTMKRMIEKQYAMAFLSIADSLDHAEIFNKDQGLQMIAKNFQEVLQSLGVSEVALISSTYDPEFSEVVEVVYGKPDNEIVEVLSKAYSMNGEIIRPGKVKVGKSVAQEENK